MFAVWQSQSLDQIVASIEGIEAVKPPETKKKVS